MEPIVESLRKGIAQLSQMAGNPADLEMALVITAGTILLLFGRKLYWFVIAAAGFAGGMVVGHEVFPPEPAWVLIVAPLLVGIVAAILSLFLQRIALRVTGMIAGGFLGYTIVAAFLVKPWPIAGLILGCIIGFWLVMTLFDWALIILSSLSGTALITQKVPLDQTPQIILAVVLFILGVSVQGTMQKKGAPAKNPPKSE